MFMTSLKFIDGATLYINGQRVFSKSLLHRFLGSVISALLEICKSVRGKYTDYIEQNVNNIHILLQLGIKITKFIYLLLSQFKITFPVIV